MAKAPGPLANGINTIRMPMAPAERGRGHPDGFRFSLNLKIERFGMAHRLS